MSFFTLKKEKKIKSDESDDWYDIMIDSKDIPSFVETTHGKRSSYDEVFRSILSMSSSLEPHPRVAHLTLESIQKIISNQEKVYPIRLKTLQSLDTIIENQQVILGYIYTMTKKINEIEYPINKQSNQGMFSSYLSPSLFPHINTDTQANSIRSENIIKRKPNPKKN